MDEVKRRIAERRAALAKERELMEAPEIAMLVAEFACVLFALMFGVAAKAEACCAMMLIAIYLKMRR